MAVRVAINGFGRIGRNILRAIIECGPQGHRGRRAERSRPGRRPTPISCASTPFTAAFPPRWRSTATASSSASTASRSRPSRIRPPCRGRSLGIDIALECTGIFTARDKAAAHLTAGAKRVLVSAPSDGADITVVYGVNHDKITPAHMVVSNASCTTNCLAPIAKVLNDAIGIEKGFMTTVHAYTGDQPTLDTMHKDLYRARAAALSMIPTSTGAAKAVGLVLPELKGKLDGVSIRVPTPNVSVIDLKVVTKRTTTPEEVNGAVERASQQELKGILDTTRHPNVSIDFNHDPHSSNFALDQTKVIDGNLVRVMSWYDNEWGFSNRMADTAVAMGKLL